MRHVVVERWSQGASPLHARDARVKTIALIFFLIVVATTRAAFQPVALGYLILLLTAAALARIPVLGALARAAVVLPFCFAFAAISLLAGQPDRAALLLEKSYLSALAVLLLVATTPLPQLLRGLESLGLPRFLLMVAQFVYRYLFVIVEQARQMGLAMACRGGLGSSESRFRAAAGALAVLFARSYERATRIHRSMLARGFEGHFPLLANPRIKGADAAFLAAALGLPLALRLSAGMWQ
ncbi:MAG: energy-coupling factor transporter transmembrane component T family protein [Bryobacteraceae bacterium]